MEIRDQVRIQMNDGLAGRLAPVRGRVIDYDQSIPRVLTIETDEGERFLFGRFNYGACWYMLHKDESGNWIRREHGHLYIITVA